MSSLHTCAHRRERRLPFPTPSGLTGPPWFGPDGTGAAAGILVQMAVDLVLILERDSGSGGGGGGSSPLVTWKLHQPSARMRHMCGATRTPTPGSSPRRLACRSDAASDLLGKLRSGIFRLLLPVTPRVLPPVTNPPSNNETRRHAAPRPPLMKRGRRRGGAVVNGDGELV